MVFGATMVKFRLTETYWTPTWCNTVQVLFLQGHSTCLGRKSPSSGVFKTSTAATGTCVIVAGQSSHLLIRVFGPNKEMWWLTCNDNTCTSGRCTSFKTPDDGRLLPKHVERPCRNKTYTVLHQVGVSFDLYYDARKHKIKIKRFGLILHVVSFWNII